MNDLQNLADILRVWKSYERVEAKTSDGVFCPHVLAAAQKVLRQAKEINNAPLQLLASKLIEKINSMPMESAS